MSLQLPAKSITRQLQPSWLSSRTVQSPLTADMVAVQLFVVHRSVSNASVTAGYGGSLGSVSTPSYSFGPYEESVQLLSGRKGPFATPIPSVPEYLQRMDNGILPGGRSEPRGADFTTFAHETETVESTADEPEYEYSGLQGGDESPLGHRFGPPSSGKVLSRAAGTTTVTGPQTSPAPFSHLSSGLRLQASTKQPSTGLAQPPAQPADSNVGHHVPGRHWAVVDRQLHAVVNGRLREVVDVKLRKANKPPV
jgi:hypothetical protein